MCSALGHQSISNTQPWLQARIARTSYRQESDLFQASITWRKDLLSLGGLWCRTIHDSCLYHCLARGASCRTGCHDTTAQALFLIDCIK